MKVEEIIDLRKKMEELVEINVENFKSDLLIDFKELKAKFLEDKKREFYWICRQCGSNLIDISCVYVKNSYSNIEIKHYFGDKTAKIFYLKIDSLKEDKDGIKIQGVIKKKMFKSVREELLKKEFKASQVDIEYSYNKKNEIFTERGIFENTDCVYYQILSKLKIEREDLIKYNVKGYIK